VYANAKSIVSTVAGKMSKSSNQALTPALSKLDYIKGAGFSLSAERNGLAGDLEVGLDPSKMDANTRAAVSIPTHPNVVLKWIPSSAYGFFALDSLKPTLQSVLSAADPNNQSAPALGALGLTGPNGALDHLTGDAGLEIDGSGAMVGGSILLATDNEAATRRTLNQLASFAEMGTGRSGSPSVRRLNYHGVGLTSIALNDAQFGSLGIQPTFAVTDGMAIIGSSLSEVEGVIDAHAANRTIASSSAFVATVGKGGTAHSIFYVDIARALSAIGRMVPASGQAEFQSLANRMAPLKAFGLTATGSPNRLSERMYLLIQ
jgi:hypothetical protein